MTTAYFIAGSIFLLFSGIGTIWAWNKKRNDEHEKAKKDLDAAVDARDWNAVDDARSRLR